MALSRSAAIALIVSAALLLPATAGAHVTLRATHRPVAHARHATAKPHAKPKRHAKPKPKPRATKAAVRRSLVLELKHHPGLIRNVHWLREADAFDVEIPAFLNLTAQTQPDTATVDLTHSGAGAPTVDLKGTIPLLLDFDAQVGFPGDIDVSVPSASIPTLASSAVPLTTDPNLSNSQTAANPGCSDFAQTGGYAGTAAGIDDPSLLTNAIGSDDDVGPGPYDSNGDPAQDVKLRTGPLSLMVVGTGNGGVANLFGLAPSSEQPVRLSVDLAADINSIVRILPDDSTYGSLDSYLQCRQVWTGVEPYCVGSFACGAPTNVFPAILDGTMQMSPALIGGRIRLATVQLSTPAGQAQPVTLESCLEPYETVAAGSAGGAGPSASSPYVNPAVSNADPAPTATCGAAGGPLSSAPFSWSAASPPRTQTFTGTFAVTNLTADLILGS